MTPIFPGKWVCSECVEDGVEIEDGGDDNIVDSTVRSDTGVNILL